jgi:hypothetical protein
MRTVLVAFLIWLSMEAAFGDDYNRIIRLEQDVRDLERQVTTLQREVAEPTSVPLGEDRSAPSDTWVDANKWQKLKLGASEMEVIELLGRPTSMRGEGDKRMLLYAMEIGSSGFLSGSVTLEDRKVVAIEMPVLK